MRITIIILAILGAVCSLLLGMKWSSDYSAKKDEVAAANSIAEGAGVQGAQKSELDAEIKEFESLGTAAKMLMVAAALAVVGAVLVLKNQSLLAAAIFAVAGILPVIFSAKTLLTTTFILIAAALTLLSSRKATPASKAAA